jgi:hypothetical protein
VTSKYVCDQDTVAEKPEDKRVSKAHRQLSSSNTTEARKSIIHGIYWSFQTYEQQVKLAVTGKGQQELCLEDGAFLAGASQLPLFHKQHATQDHSPTEARSISLQ